MSPALPLTPPPTQTSRPQETSNKPILSTPPFPPPLEPLPWLWTCHLCDSRYPLGVTRKCLNDGHTFCSGTTRDKTTGVIKRHRSCNSEFDYVGWSDWQHWRKELRKDDHNGCSTEKNCSQECEYPSECRWGRRAGSIAKKAKKAMQDEPMPGFTSQTTPEEAQPSSKDLIVDKIVAAVKRETKASGLRLSTVAEEAEDLDEMVSPTSPLKQHYTLPQLNNLDDMVSYYTADEDTERRCASVIGLADTSDGLDAGITDAAAPYDELSPPTPDWIDVDSDSESSVGDGADVDQCHWDDDSLYMTSSNAALRKHIGLDLHAKIVGRRESDDSGYGSLEDDAVSHNGFGL